MSLRDEIERNVERIPESGCWIWTKSLRGKGYGQFTHPGRKQEGAHRVSYRAYKGEIPEGVNVCHKCDVPSCVNPDHLFLGSASVNALDAVKKGKWNPGRVGRPKLTPEQREEVRFLWAMGMLQRQIAEHYGITQVRVSQICRGLAP